MRRYSIGLLLMLGWVITTCSVDETLTPAAIGTSGTVPITISGEEIRATYIDDAGNIFIATQTNGNNGKLIKYLSDGSGVDSSFGTDGQTTFTTSNSSITSLKQNSAGDIYVGSADDGQDHRIVLTVFNDAGVQQWQNETTTSNAVQGMNVLTGLYPVDGSQRAIVGTAVWSGQIGSHITYLGRLEQSDAQGGNVFKSSDKDLSRSMLSATATNFIQVDPASTGPDTYVGIGFGKSQNNKFTPYFAYNYSDDFGGGVTAFGQGAEFLFDTKLDLTFDSYELFDAQFAESGQLYYVLGVGTSGSDTYLFVLQYSYDLVWNDTPGGGEITATVTLELVTTQKYNDIDNIKGQKLYSNPTHVYASFMNEATGEMVILRLNRDAALSVDTGFGTHGLYADIDLGLTGSSNAVVIDDMTIVSGTPNQYYVTVRDTNTTDTMYLHASNFQSQIPPTPPAPQNPVIPAGQGQGGPPPEPGDNFGTNGIVQQTLPADHQATAICLDMHGNTIVAGRVASGATSNANAVFVARFDETGAFDSTFGTGGIGYAPQGTGTDDQNEVHADVVTTAKSGRVLVAGQGNYQNKGANYVAAISFDSQGSLQEKYTEKGKTGEYDRRPVTYHAPGLEADTYTAGGVLVDSTLSTYVVGLGEKSSDGYGVVVTNFKSDMEVYPAGDIFFTHQYITENTVITDIAMDDAHDDKLFIAGYTVDMQSHPKDHIVFLLEVEVVADKTKILSTVVLDENHVPGSFLEVSKVKIDLPGRKLYVGGFIQTNTIAHGVFTRGYSFSVGQQGLQTIGAVHTDLDGGELAGITNVVCEDIVYDDTYLYLFTTAEVSSQKRALISRYKKQDFLLDTDEFGTNGFYLEPGTYTSIDVAAAQLFRENRLRASLYNDTSRVVVQGLYDVHDVPQPDPHPNPPTPSPTPPPTPQPRHYNYDAQTFFVFQLVQLGDHIANLRYYLALDEYYEALEYELERNAVTSDRAFAIGNAVAEQVDIAFAAHQARKNADSSYNLVFHLDDLLHSLPGATQINITPALTTAETEVVNSVLQALVQNGMNLFNLVKQG